MGQRSSRAVVLGVWRTPRCCAISSAGWIPTPSLKWTPSAIRRWNDLATSHRKCVSTNTHTLTCCLGYVLKSMIPDGERTDKSLIRFRGKGRWSRSIRGSVAYRMRRAHPYDFVGKSSQRHGRTLKPGSQESLLRNSLRSWRSPMVGKRDRLIQTLCCLRRYAVMDYDSGGASMVV